MTQVAALFVETGGVYYGFPDVDPWDEARDARLYDGPHPVIAHPPCERWGAFWSGGPYWLGKGNPPKQLGDDGGCFEAALSSVRKWGGVLEHPKGSRAWQRFGLLAPPAGGGWVNADWQGGWTCCVEQGSYGHKARKATWLYACKSALPILRWGASAPDDSWQSERARQRAAIDGACVLLSHKERAATPIPFRDLLLSIVRGKEVPMP